MHRGLADIRRGAARRTPAAAAAFLIALLLAAAPAARAATLSPFEARFNVVWHGMGAGTAELTLQHGSDGHWTYESRNVARGIFRLAVPNEIRQSSELRIEGDHVVPLHFVTDDGSENGKRDADVRFDWDAGRATGTSEGKRVDAALQDGVQDTLSVQIALIHELLAGRTPEQFLLLDGNEIKEYEYRADGRETVESALGRHETVKYRSRRPGSDRSTVFWCAPELGYLPVKVERQKGGKVEWSMNLAELKR